MSSPGDCAARPPDYEPCLAYWLKRMFGLKAKAPMSGAFCLRQHLCEVIETEAQLDKQRERERQFL